MGIFYIFLTLIPCVIGQLQERWVRYIAKKWILQDGAVDQQTLTGSWAPTVEIRYRFEVNGESHSGVFLRRYQNKDSAGNVPIYESGARIKILVDPKIPDRSYFPLPLSMWGLLYAAPIAVLTLVAVFGGLYAGLEQRRFEAKHRIPESAWKTIRYSRIFNIRLPGDTLHNSGTSSPMAIDGDVPVYFSWISRREGFFFSAFLYEYRLPPAPDKVFALFRNLYATGSGRTPPSTLPWSIQTCRPALKLGTHSLGPGRPDAYLHIHSLILCRKYTYGDAMFT